MTVTTRPLKPSDVAFVRSSWFESMWKGYASRAGMSFATYDRSAGAFITRALKECPTIVVTPVGLDDHICGWACCRGTALLYVYVRSPYRKLGIATGLVEGAVNRYVLPAFGHGKGLVTKLKLDFDPFLPWTMT